MRSRCRCPRFSQAWMVCERSSILATFGSDKICLLLSRLLPAANGSYKAASLCHCSKPGSRSAPRTTSRASSSVLRSRNVAILDPSRSSLQSHVGDLSRQSVASCSPHSSSPVSALHAVRRRRPLPNTTRFSNSAILLPESIWHHTLRLHQSNA